MMRTDPASLQFLEASPSCETIALPLAYALRTWRCHQTAMIANQQQRLALPTTCVLTKLSRAMPTNVSSTTDRATDCSSSCEERKSKPSQSAPQLLPVTPVGILAEKLQNLQAALQQNGVSDEALAELAHCGKLASGLDKYVSQCTTPESDALQQLAEDTSKEDWSEHFSDGATLHELEREMLSGHAEGQLLKFLVGMSNAKSVLEIGMFTGYSALAMAEQLLEDCSSSESPKQPRVVACELDPYTAEFAKTRFAKSPAGKLIDVRVAPAIETLRQLAEAGDQFDFVFIDADKTGYLTYYKKLLDQNLLTDRAIVCVDNTLLQGQTYAVEGPNANGTAVAEFNAFVANDPRVEQVLLPIRDGVTLIRRVSDRALEGQS